MKFVCVILVCLAGFLYFKFYTPSKQSFQFTSPNESNVLGDVNYIYGRRYHQPLPLSKSNANQSVIKAATAYDLSKKISNKELNKFKNILELSNDSFNYVLTQMSCFEVNQLMGAGLLLIQLHPKKARRYAHRLLECHLLQNKDTIDQETSSVEAKLAPPILVPNLKRGIDHVNDMAATLSVSALSFYNWFSWTKLFEFIWFMLQALYYATTCVGCLLVAFFIGDRWFDHSAIKSGSPPSASWPPASDKFSVTNADAPGKIYPHAIPL